MQECDPLLMVGIGFPWAEFLPRDRSQGGPDRYRCFQCCRFVFPPRSTGPSNLHRNPPFAIPLLQPKADRSWRDKIEKGLQD